MERPLSVEELRYYTLYWDQVLIPGNNLVYIAIPDEEQWIAAGAISRPRVAFQGAFKGDQLTHALLSCQNLVASEMRTKAPLTDWVIHQVGDDVVVPEEIATTKEVVRVSFLSALPVPTEPTPIYDLLEFKHTYRAEFVGLHESMDDLYLEVLRSPDPSLSHRKAIARFKESIGNVSGAVRNRYTTTRKFDFSTELRFDATRISGAASAGAALDLLTTGFSIPWALIAGAAAMLKISLKASTAFQAVKDQQKLAYLARAARSGILPGSAQR
jgi:hypothetical protein